MLFLLCMNAGETVIPKGRCFPDGLMMKMDRRQWLNNLGRCTYLTILRSALSADMLISKGAALAQAAGDETG